jgi:hypothetical protein
LQTFQDFHKFLALQQSVEEISLSAAVHFIPCCFCFSLAMCSIVRNSTRRILRHLLGIVVVTGLSTSFLTAQESGFAISLGADVLAPLGEFRSEVLTGYGGSIKFNLFFSERLALVASVGLMSFEGKSDSLSSLRGSPMRAGLKFYLVPNASTRVYCAGEAGLFVSTDKQNKSQGFSAAPIAGLEFLVGKTTCLDLSARYDYVDVSGRKRASLGVRVAASFPL